MRPKTIVYFERFIFGAILLNVLQVYLAWDEGTTKFATARPNWMFAIIILLIFTFVLNGTLTLLVSRRRSKIAMWVLIPLFVLCKPLVFVQFTREAPGTDIISAAQIIGILLAYGLLFTPSARRWMRREDEKNEKVREVFE